MNLRDAGNTVIPLDSTIGVLEGSVTNFFLWTADGANVGKDIEQQNNIPSGTTVALSASAPYTLGGVTQLTVSDSSRPDVLRFTITKSNADPVNGTLTATYTTPLNVITTQIWTLEGPPP